MEESSVEAATRDGYKNQILLLTLKCQKGAGEGKIRHIFASCASTETESLVLNRLCSRGLSCQSNLSALVRIYKTLILNPPAIESTMGCALVNSPVMKTPCLLPPHLHTPPLSYKWICSFMVIRGFSKSRRRRSNEVTWGDRAWRIGRFNPMSFLICGFFSLLICFVSFFSLSHRKPASIKQKTLICFYIVIILWNQTLHLKNYLLLFSKYLIDFKRPFWIKWLLLLFQILGDWCHRPAVSAGPHLGLRSHVRQREHGGHGVPVHHLQFAAGNVHLHLPLRAAEEGRDWCLQYVVGSISDVLPWTWG